MRVVVFAAALVALPFIIRLYLAFCTAAGAAWHGARQGNLWVMEDRQRAERRASNREARAAIRRFMERDPCA